jgi:hypothetical protein
MATRRAGSAVVGMVVVMVVGVLGPTARAQTVAWTQRVLSGPLAWSELAMAHDAAHVSTVLFGGRIPDNVSNETWVLGSPCGPADYDQNGRIEPADVALFVNTWFTSLQAGTLAGDFDHNGLIQPADVALFVNTWFTAVMSGGC